MTEKYRRRRTHQGKGAESILGRPGPGMQMEMGVELGWFLGVL